MEIFCLFHPGVNEDTFLSTIHQFCLGRPNCICYNFAQINNMSACAEVCIDVHFYHFMLCVLSCFFNWSKMNITLLTLSAKPHVHINGAGYCCIRRPRATSSRRLWWGNKKKVFTPPQPQKGEKNHYWMRALFPTLGWLHTLFLPFLSSCF